MPGTDLMFTHALVSATGWTLVHFLWQGCLIALAFWLVCVLSPRESAHLRYWAGIAGLVLSLSALALTFAVYFEPAAQFSFEAKLAEPVNQFLVLSGDVPDAWPLVQEGIEPVLPLVVILWLAGMLVNGARTACGWIGVSRLIGGSLPLTDPGVMDLAMALRDKLQVRQAVRIFESARCSMPLAVGWLKPIILLPSSVLAGLPRDQLELILAHELVHIRRYDYLVNLLQVVAETVLFYHPAIMWISRRVREERENCCDDGVVSRCGKPATYARALANLEVLRHPLPSAVLAAGGGDLLGRIKRIVNRELPRTSSGYAQLCALVVVASVVALGAHQGSALSRALHQVAGTAHLQASDVEWKTWGRSREAWGAGMLSYATSLGGGKVDEVVLSQTSVPAEVSIEAADDESGNPAPHSTIVPDRLLAAIAVQPQDETGSPGSARPESAIGPMPERHEYFPGPIPQSEASMIGMVPSGFEASAGSPPSTDVPATGIRSRGSDELDPISTVRPKYPWRARVNGVEGFVELAFEVDRDGNVSDVEVLGSIPEGIFDRAASSAVRKWKFLPLADGLEPVRMVKTFDFSLEERVELRKKRRSCAVTGRRTCSRAPSAAVVVYVNPPSHDASHVAVTN